MTHEQCLTLPKDFVRNGQSTPMNHKFHSTLGVDITSLQIYNLGVYWQYWKGFFSHRMPIICNLRAFKSFPHEYVVLREFFQEFLLHQKARQLINIDFSSSFFCIGLLLATVCIFGLIWVLTNCGMNPHKFCQRNRERTAFEIF